MRQQLGRLLKKIIPLNFTTQYSMIEPTTIDYFYQQIANGNEATLQYLLPSDYAREIGHINVFDIADFHQRTKGKPMMPYNRRAYYKISLICGRNTVEYADRTIEIERSALLFATPKVPYHYVPKGGEQTGSFCVFTEAFLSKTMSGMAFDDLPIFKAGGYPIFHLPEEAVAELTPIFQKMRQELTSDYAYKYDLLRNYVCELIHYGQKLQPATAIYATHNAATRVCSLFLELLERQFPIASAQQKVPLRSAKEYAERLAIHVNHLNKVLKENTGKTTTELIAERLTKEAKILLRQTDWSISEIAYCLGFEEVAHFSNFFRKQTTLAPLVFRT